MFPLERAQGAYSCLCLVKGVGLVAFRDPFGIRPLVLGRRASPLGDEYCVASEDCAFGPIGFERVRDINPGEMVIIGQDGKLISRQVRVAVCGGAGMVPPPSWRHFAWRHTLNLFVRALLVCRAAGRAQADALHL